MGGRALRSPARARRALPAAFRLLVAAATAATIGGDARSQGAEHGDAALPTAPDAAATGMRAAVATPVPSVPLADLPAVLPQLDLARLLAGRSADWRAARLAGNPAVMIVEFPGLSEQGDALNRVAALVEKAGAPRDRLLDDAALQALMARSGDNKQTFYQGHNYSSDNLARFFNLARAQRLRLHAQEERLADLLLRARLLALHDERYAAQGRQALIAFPATQPDDPRTPMDEGVDAIRRESILRHELSHGAYLTDAAYREHCRRYWRHELGEADRRLFRRFLASRQYDASNEELMIDEMQAFLVHTPDERAFDAKSLGVGARRLQELRARFRAGLPAGG